MVGNVCCVLTKRQQRCFFCLPRSFNFPHTGLEPVEPHFCVILWRIPHSPSAAHRQRSSLLAMKSVVQLQYHLLLLRHRICPEKMSSLTLMPMLALVKSIELHLPITFFPVKLYKSTYQQVSRQLATLLCPNVSNQNPKFYWTDTRLALRVRKLEGKPLYRVVSSFKCKFLVVSLFIARRTDRKRKICLRDVIYTGNVQV